MKQRASLIGNRLTQTRLALGYATQIDFAAQAGIDQSVYNPYETGKRRISLDAALRIRDRFGVSLDWIYCGDASGLPAALKKLGRTG